MDFSVNMTALGAAVLVAGALVIGLVAQFIGEVRTNWHWIVVAIFAFAGALFASEAVKDWRTIEPVWEGLALLPALIGGIVLGVAADVVLRLAMGESYTHGHRAA